MYSLIFFLILYQVLQQKQSYAGELNSLQSSEKGLGG